MQKELDHIRNESDASSKENQKLQSEKADLYHQFLNEKDRAISLQQESARLEAISTLQ